MVVVSHGVSGDLNDSDNRSNGYKLPHPSDKEIRQTFYHYNDGNADNDNQKSRSPDLPEKKLTGKRIENSQIMRPDCFLQISHKSNQRVFNPGTHRKKFGR